MENSLQSQLVQLEFNRRPVLHGGVTEKLSGFAAIGEKYYGMLHPKISVEKMGIYRL